MDPVKKVNRNLPKISIIVTSYNKKKYIAQTLQSILDQRYPNLEIIVIDDGSTDNSLQIINSFARKNPKTVKVYVQKNQGQKKATNLGITKSKGEILNFLNSDDYFEENILSEIGEYFHNNPTVLWLTGYCDIVNQNNNQIYPWVTLYKNFLLKINKYFLLLIVNYITCSGVFIRTLAIEKKGKFKNKKNIFLEYDLWLKLGKLQPPKVIKKKLVHFRLMPDNLTFTKYREILLEDYLTTKKYTSNQLILFLHKINNWGRILLIKIYDWEL